MRVENTQYLLQKWHPNSSRTRRSPAVTGLLELKSHYNFSADATSLIVLGALESNAVVIIIAASAAVKNIGLHCEIVAKLQEVKRIKMLFLILIRPEQKQADTSLLIHLYMQGQLTANMKLSVYVCLMSGQRRRRWASINTVLVERFVFAGITTTSGIYIYKT